MHAGTLMHAPSCMCSCNESASGSLLHALRRPHLCLTCPPINSTVSAQVDPEAWPDLKRQLLAVLTSSTRSSKPTIFGMAAEADTSSMR